ncbi:MAG: hypothetical protein JSU92_00570 [Deltaproteobacteria bacterium]|nr:MAG: hypothetical protein JSU92_00570 [Deltaproteobacteria bacterium]
MKYIKRIFLCMLAVSLVGWFGISFGPQRGEVGAGLTDYFKLFFRGSPLPVPPSGKVDEPRSLRINNMNVYLTQGSVKGGGINGLIDYYSRLYQGTTKKTFQTSDDNMGILGVVDGDLREGKDNIASIAKSLNTLLAFKDKRNGEVSYFNFFTDGSFGPEGFLYDRNGDAPGRDPDDVPRYPGSRRVMTIETERNKGQGVTLIYENPGSLVGNKLYYRTAFRRKGWEVDPSFEEGLNKRDLGLLFFKKPKKECFISLEENRGRGGVNAIVVCREER